MTTFKITSAPNEPNAGGELVWAEPGKMGGALKFDVRVATFDGQPAKDIQTNALKEALRLAQVFIDTHTEQIG